MTSLVNSVALDDNLALRQAELAALIQRQCPGDGLHRSAISGLDLACATQPSLPIPVLYRPCLGIIAQGRKNVRLGDEQYTYDPLNYLVASVTLPVTSQVIGATPELPYLSLRLEIDPALITSLIAEIGPIGVPNTGQRRALYLDRLDTQLLDAVLRLLHLLETPRDIGILAPLAVREIFYRLLHSPQGHRLHEIAIADSQGQRINRAIEWFRLAAAQGNAFAQNKLGEQYKIGEGVERDYAQALKWFKLSADQGYAAAQSNLGQLYQFGLGVTADEDEAIKWFKLAADQGNSLAKSSLAAINKARADKAEKERQDKLRKQREINQQILNM